MSCGGKSTAMVKSIISFLLFCLAAASLVLCGHSCCVLPVFNYPCTFERTVFAEAQRTTKKITDDRSNLREKSTVTMTPIKNNRKPKSPLQYALWPLQHTMPWCVAVWCWWLMAGGAAYYISFVVACVVVNNYWAQPRSDLLGPLYDKEL